VAGWFPCKPNICLDPESQRVQPECAPGDGRILRNGKFCEGQRCAEKRFGHSLAAESRAAFHCCKGSAVCSKPTRPLEECQTIRHRPRGSRSSCGKVSQATSTTQRSGTEQLPAHDNLCKSTGRHEWRARMRRQCRSKKLIATAQFGGLHIELRVYEQSIPDNAAASAISRPLTACVLRLHRSANLSLNSRKLQTYFERQSHDRFNRGVVRDAQCEPCFRNAL